MICRKDITVHKIWNDNDNAYNTRPNSVELTLLRDGKVYKTAVVTAANNWTYTFGCLPIWNHSNKYDYTVDETAVPNGYYKTISGYNITNTLNEINANGIKIWDDNHNSLNKRPSTITVSLLRDGTSIRSIQLNSPSAGVDAASFDFGAMPFADSQGKPYVYTVDESAVAEYKKTITGFSITNKLITGEISFAKTSVATGLGLQGAVFEIRQSGMLIDTSTSDENGNVYFYGLMPGTYQMTETIFPIGYMSNTTVYDLTVLTDGSVTVDGKSLAEFSVNNAPWILVQRATAVVPAYMAEPNTWTLHGTGTTDLYMTDKIVITTQVVPVKVKWEYGVKDVSYFASGGGYDITASYTNGIPTTANGDYTVYLLFASGYEVAIKVTIDNIRDGSVAMPYLLIDYTTASALEPSVTGIGIYNLDFMQTDDIKLTKNYELYEKVDMTVKTWAPLGDATTWGFVGTFYGNGNDIENMSVSTSTGSTYNTGMFARVSNGAVIENLGLINSTIANSRWNAAGIAGIVATGNGGTTILRDLRFSGSVTANSTGAGIVSAISVINGDVLIDGCTVDGAITGVSCGGIAGFASIQSAGAVTITNCFTTGSCSSTGTSVLNYAGGILGASSDTGNGQFKIENCANAMTVLSNAKAGGMVGTGTSAYTSIISSCLNTGSITGVNQVGGMVGGFTNSSATNMMTIENCYNTAKITAAVATAGYAGGIIGICYSYANVKNCYNAGDVTAVASGTQNVVGGISGNYGVIENCAAINSLCSSRQSSVARVSQSTASASVSVLTNNVAFENMQVLINGTQKTPLDIGLNNTDGLSAAAAVIKTQVMYQTTLGWDFTSAWSFGNGGYTLPVLRGIPLSIQPVVLPSHL